MATQNNKEHFSSGLAKVLKEQWQVDVRLKAGDNDDDASAIPAHKLILASRSEVFKKMLESDELKTSSKEVETITLSEMKQDELEALVEFMYSDTGSTISEKVLQHARSLYQAADKYEIPYLRDLCRSELISSLNSSNALNFLEFAQIPFDEVLNDAAFSCIKENIITIASIKVEVVAKKNSVSDSREGSDDDDLPTGLKRKLMPRHVGIILDGNRRWAKRQGLETFQGHEAGAKRFVDFIKICIKWKIETVSAFAFSTENWGRSKIELDFLMAIFENFLKLKKTSLQKGGIKTSIIGNKTKLPQSLLRVIDEVEEATKNNTKLHLILAIDYSGRFDFLQACKSLVQKTEQGLIGVDDVNEALIDKELLTKCTDFPQPDLLIRTSGEQRISNFFLWQLAYTELFFTPVLWPDFGQDEFFAALASYQLRERRFGGESDPS